MPWWPGETYTVLTWMVTSKRPFHGAGEKEAQVLNQTVQLGLESENKGWVGEGIPSPLMDTGS